MRPRNLNPIDLHVFFANSNTGTLLGTTIQTGITQTMKWKFQEVEERRIREILGTQKTRKKRKRMSSLLTNYAQSVQFERLRTEEQCTSAAWYGFKESHRSKKTRGTSCSSRGKEISLNPRCFQETS